MELVVVLLEVVCGVFVVGVWSGGGQGEGVVVGVDALRVHSLCAFSTESVAPARRWTRQY